MAADATNLDREIIPTRGRIQTRFSIGRIMRWLLRRETPAERINRIAKEREALQARQLDKALAMEARQYSEIITAKLADLNVCWRYHKTAGGKERVQLVRWQEVRWSPEAIYLKVDFRPGKSPRGVSVANLMEPNILTVLGVACTRRVSCAVNPNGGFWYIIERQEGVRGIPSHVQYNEMIERRPPHADRLSLPLGVGEGRKIHWHSLNKMYSMLIAGAQGQGKSNAINAFLCTLLAYNAPENLQFALVDLKGGVEFSFFNGLPRNLLRMPPPKPPKKATKLIHTVEMSEDGQAVETDALVTDTSMEADDFDLGAEMVPALVEKREYVPHLLQWIVREGERRLALIKAAKVKDIGQYNFHAQSRARLPHIILAVDEWADVKLDRKVGRLSEDLIINICSRFRAAGIHVLLCTQTPNKDVISIRVKNVLPAKMAFSCPDPHASMLIIGTGQAHGLSPVGRCIFEWGNSRNEIQTPYITTEMIEQRVSAAASGQLLAGAGGGPRSDVTEMALIELALEKFNGLLNQAQIYRELKGRISHADLDRMLAGLENREFVVGSTAVTVLPAGINLPRRVVSIDNPADAAPEMEPAAPEELPAEPFAAPPPPAPAPAAPSELAQEIMEWAVRSAGGVLKTADIRTAFKGRISRDGLYELVKTLDGLVVDVDGRTWRVLAPSGPPFPKPRRMVPEEGAPGAVDAPGAAPKSDSEPGEQPALSEPETEIPILRDGDDAVDGDADVAVQSD